MNNQTKPTNISLAEIAKEAMVERDLLPDFPQSVLDELSKINEPAKPLIQYPFHDMRDALWFSIDNDDSLDLDQLTYAQVTSSGTNKIYVAVADVDSLVPRASQVDQNAFHNTTSVYTPTLTFPMLPTKLSTNLTSLNENEDRCAFVIEMDVADDGQYNPVGIYPAWVRNKAKLAYNRVADWLIDKVDQPFASRDVPGLSAQLRLQDKLAQKIKEYRFRQGALSFGSIEIVPVIENGVAVGLEESTHNRAHVIIENFMIAANVAMTKFLMERNLPVMKRVVRTPERWDRIMSLAKDRGEVLPPVPDVKSLRDFLLKERKKSPETFPDLSLAVIKLIGRGEYVLGTPNGQGPGHFDLAIHDYAHTTAPNRRYPDIVMQRLLKSFLFGHSIPYSDPELSAIAQRCTQKEDDATKVERKVKKSAAAMVLSSQIGQEFDALVTGASHKGTWVRLAKPPIEGKLVRGFQSLDVGDRVKVRLEYVDIPKGFIDFVRA